jgi:hypothetical protein
LSGNETTEIVQEEAIFDNNYSEQISKESDNTTEEFYSGPRYEANWTFINKETVRIVFSLFSISKLSNEKNSSNKNIKKINLFPNMISIPSRSIQSIYSLKYFLFTIRQYKTNTEKVIQKIEPLILKTTPLRNYEHFSNSLLLSRLNPKERYSICIYYYQNNSSIEMPNFIICQDLMHDHLKHSVHGLLFILTQYSIILGILIVLQGLYSMKKRRLAHIVHQRLMDKAQRLCSRLSSVSLIRQSCSSMDATLEQQTNAINGHINHEENKLKKRIISSPAIVLNEPSIIVNNGDEHEPFLKLSSAKNHVHFVLGLDGGFDDNESEDILSDTTLNLRSPPTHSEPYDDRSDAFLSMAHILDTNKPWSKYNNPTIPD